MASIKDILAHMTACASLEEVWRIHIEAMEMFHFDRLLYALTVTHNDEVGQALSDVLVLSNHDKAYTDKFIHGGMHRDAPMLKWALRNHGVCSWSWLTERVNRGELSQTEQRVVDFNLRHQVTAGYTISFQSGVGRRKSAIALTAKRGMTQDEVNEIWAEHGEDIYLINRVMNLCAITLPAKKMLHRLTRRQREVLELIGDGMSLADVAHRLDLSSATVEKHLRLAREALGSETTAQAAIKAAMQQQLYVSAEQ